MTLPESQVQPATPERIAHLASEAKSGDAHALVALHDHLSGPLWNHINRRCGGDRELTDDISSDTWETVMREIGAKYHPERGAFVTWLYKIAENRSIDLARRSGLKRVTREVQAHMLAYGSSEASVDAGPEELAVSNDEQKRLVRVVNGLPARQRAAVLAVDYNGMTTAEAAQLLNTSEGNIRAARARGLAALRAKLRPVRRNGMAPSPVNMIVRVEQKEVRDANS